MKRFKVYLSIGSFSYVHATHYADEGQWTRFYRGDGVVSEYATISVKLVEEVRGLDEPPSTKGERVRPVA